MKKLPEIQTTPINCIDMPDKFGRNHRILFMPTSDGFSILGSLVKTDDGETFVDGVVDVNKFFVSDSDYVLPSTVIEELITR